MKLASKKTNVFRDREQPKEEAEIHFPSPVPLKRMGTVLDIIRDGSSLYGLRKVRAPSFLHQIIESHRKLPGKLLVFYINHPGGIDSVSWWFIQNGAARPFYTRRTAIKARMHAMLPTPLTALMKDVEYLALMTYDTPIHSVFMRLVRIAETQDVRQASLFNQCLYLLTLFCRGCCIAARAPRCGKSSGRT